MAALLAYGSVVLKGEDVHVEGQTRGACICLAVAQKCLAFHTAPLGSLVESSARSFYEKQRERRNQEGENNEEGGVK